MPTIADIVLETRDLVDADSVSYPDATLLRRINDAYEEIVSIIMGCDGRWQFDDTNYTDFPIATTNLVNSQSDYSFDATHLEIERVEVKDNGGNWHLLEPVDISQIDVALSEFYKDDGQPLCYDKKGGSLVLYPAPDNGVSVTLTSGLKVYFKRTSDNFTSGQVTTGTKKPGFASPFHHLISYKAALPFAAKYKKDRVQFLLKHIEDQTKELIKHYSRREQDRRKRFDMQYTSSH